MTVLIIGATGFLGSELVRQGRSAGRATAATFHSRPGNTPGALWHHLDLRDPQQLDAVLDAVAPESVINASSGEADWATTADGPVRLAATTARCGIRLVHVSSNSVFSEADSPYDETVLPDPVTPYGGAKAASETTVRLLHPDVVVVCSLGVGPLHELAAYTRKRALFRDDVRCPVHVADLAAALWELAASNATGVFHLAGTDAVSRYELGELIARRDGLDTARLPSPRRSDTSLSGGLDIRLDSRATQQKLNIWLRGAREFLSEGRPEPA